MMNKEVIYTTDAPQAIGTYSQAIRAGDLVFLSGQLGIDPLQGHLLEGVEAQTHQVFGNLRAITLAAGGNLSDIVRLGVFLTDLSNFARFNEIMSEYFTEPYPARAAVQVSALPKGGVVEAEAVMFRPSE